MLAEPADGPIAKQISALARRFELAIHYGSAERDGDNLCNAAQIFGPDGMRLARAGATAEVIAAKIVKNRVKDAQNRLPYHRDVGKIQLDNYAPPSADAL